MRHCIFVGIDLHDRTMVLKWAVGSGRIRSVCYANDRPGREAMVERFGRLAEELDGAEVVFAYEASGEGFGLCDELCEAGFICYVLAPTRMPRSRKDRSQRNDGRDARKIVSILKAHVLAGCDLPSVWVPERQTRDDREVTRARLDLADKQTVVKNQVRSLLKRQGVVRPEGIGAGWCRGYRAWLRGLVRGGGPLSAEAKVALRTLIAQLGAIEKEIRHLDRDVAALSRQERYAHRADALTELKGVGLLTAMVFLTEMGDLSRFGNRRQVGSYVGLVPWMDESGESGERKGHITRQGPWRVRRMLCQATWARVRTDPSEREMYEGICRRNPKHKKKAVVAVMRRLAVRMWHAGLRAGQVEAVRNAA